MIFESHAHYDDEAFDEDREELLEGLREAGVGKVINVSASVEGMESSLALAGKYPFIYAAVGVHPDGVGEMDGKVIARMHSLARDPKTVAIGEIGLDYYWDKENHEVQKVVEGAAGGSPGREASFYHSQPGSGGGYPGADERRAGW